MKEIDADKICNPDIPDDALYKLSGNSIVVDVLVEIFKQLFIPIESQVLEINENLHIQAA